MNPALESWQSEIQTLSGGVLVMVPVETDPVENVLRIPPSFPGRPIVAQLLSNESFVVQLTRAHALNANVSGPQGVHHFILLNMARSADWKDLEDSLLAHEFGHVWLNAMGYRALDSSSDPLRACLATHAGDMVQHILIREEGKRRGLDVSAFWLRIQETALSRENQPLPELSRCERWQAAAEWLDAVEGAPGWPLLPRYEMMMRRRFPQLIEPLAVIRSTLHGRDLWDRSLYEYALRMLTDILLTIS